MEISILDLDPAKEPVQLRRLVNRFQRCTGLPLEKIFVNEEVALLVWLHSVLVTRNTVSTEYADLIIDEFKDALTTAAKMTAEDFSSPVKDGQKEARVQLISVLDSTIVTMTGCPEFLDLRTGNRIRHIPQPPIEMVTYNLTSLFFFHACRIRERHAASTKAQEGG